MLCALFCILSIKQHATTLLFQCTARPSEVNIWEFHAFLSVKLSFHSILSDWGVPLQKSLLPKFFLRPSISTQIVNYTNFAFNPLIALVFLLGKQQGNLMSRQESATVSPQSFSIAVVHKLLFCVIFTY